MGPSHETVPNESNVEVFHKSVSDRETPAAKSRKSKWSDANNRSKEKRQRTGRTPKRWRAFQGHAESARFWSAASPLPLSLQPDRVLMRLHPPVRDKSRIYS